MKKLLIFVISTLMLLTLVACKRDKHEHTPTRVEAISPTCIKSGNSEYWHCSGCDKLFSDEACTAETTLEAQIIASLGHTWQDADCENPRNCTVCTYKQGWALGHMWCADCDNTCDRDGCDETRKAASHVDLDEDEVCDQCDLDLVTHLPGSDGGGTLLPKDEFE